MKTFKPTLAIDATEHLENIRYPKLASYKLDGIRVIFHPELGIVSRSLKPIKNKQLNEKFSYMLNAAKKFNRTFDGEFYAHKLNFQEITRAVMTEDFHDEKTIKKLCSEHDTIDEVAMYIKNLIDSIKFFCFDTMSTEIDETFINRMAIFKSILIGHDSYIPVHQKTVRTKEEVLALFDNAISDGYEGLILRDFGAPYKFGRSTLKEEYMLKVKPFKTFDARIEEVIQATEVDPNAEKKTNELGRSVTSRKIGDRIPIEKAAAFRVKYNEHDLKVSIAMTDPEKEEVWKNRESYIGRMIEYKGMIIGSKDVPRHPVFVRFRDDRQ